MNAMKKTAPGTLIEDGNKEVWIKLQANPAYAITNEHVVSLFYGTTRHLGDLPLPLHTITPLEIMW